MKKILPNLYKGKIKIRNKNQNIAVVNEIEEKIRNAPKKDNSSINGKIKDIFNSPGYVYKADVSIELDDGTNIKKTIIGRTNNSLITIDDELIDVSRIVKINFY